LKDVFFRILAFLLMSTAKALKAAIVLSGPIRKGKIQLVGASSFYHKMRKSLGSKRNEEKDNTCLERDENMLKIGELRKLLAEMPNDELTNLMVESYKLSKEVQILVNIRLKGDEEVDRFLQVSKTKIRNEFLPSRGFGKLRVGTVKKAVSDFKKIGKNENFVIDLMIFSVEMGVEFIEQFGDISESMVDYMDDTFDKIIVLINNSNDYELFAGVQNRLKAIIADTNGVGCWGINDSLEESFSEIIWLDDEKR